MVLVPTLAHQHPQDDSKMLILVHFSHKKVKLSVHIHLPGVYASMKVDNWTQRTLFFMFLISLHLKEFTRRRSKRRKMETVEERGDKESTETERRHT